MDGVVFFLPGRDFLACIDSSAKKQNKQVARVLIVCLPGPSTVLALGVGGIEMDSVHVRRTQIDVISCPESSVYCCIRIFRLLGVTS